MQNDNEPVAPAYPIESVNNALKLILLFRDHESVKVAEASEVLGVARSTAHRMLQMLQYHAFVRQDPRSKSYVPGPALLDVGLAVIRAMDIRGMARPFLEQLASEFDETVHLIVPEQPDVRFVDCVESTRAVRVSSRVGMTLPAHVTSVGKSILATMTDDEVKRLYPDAKLNAQTSHSLKTRAALLKELAAIRKAGYATSREESEDDVGSVGVALRGSSGEVVGAISVAAPISRMSVEHAEVIAARLLEVADQLAETIPRTVRESGR